jgi:uncharacterized protein YcfJ
MKTTKTFVIVGTGMALLAATGCSNLPGNEKSQGAVIGGLGGAVAGAAIGGKENRLLGAILGGALGAGGGYVIGAQVDRVKDKDSDGAQRAVRNAQERPATVEEARKATTADLNSDGFVTLDEMVAMEKADISDDNMIARLEATDQVFDLTNEQRNYLRDQGVSDRVISALSNINREARERLLGSTTADDVISRPSSTQ